MKKLYLLAVIFGMHVFSGGEIAFSQCSPNATEGGAVAVSPTCADQAVGAASGIGPGAWREYTGFAGNVYYTVSLNDPTGGLTCRSARFYNGGTALGTWFSVTGATTQLAPAGTDRIRVETTRSGTHPGNNTAYSAVLTYRKTTPGTTTAAASNGTICLGGSSSISASLATNGITLYWQGTNSVGTSTATAGSPQSVSPSPTGSYTYYYNSYNSGCWGPATGAVVTVVADPGITISGATTICSGGTATLNSSVSGGTGTLGYQWQSSTSSGGTYTNVSGGSGALTASYTTGALTGTMFYRCLYSATGAGCGTAVSNIEQVTVNNDPGVATSPGTLGTICQGGTSNSVSALGNGGISLSYKWQYNNAGSWQDVTNTVPAVGSPGTELEFAL